MTKKLLTQAEHEVLEVLKARIDSGFTSVPGYCKIRNWSDMDAVYLEAKYKDKDAGIKGVIYSDLFSGESEAVIEIVAPKIRKGFKIHLG
jgi:hypothetical protein